jgi:hypothetical protein
MGQFLARLAQRFDAEPAATKTSDLATLLTFAALALLLSIIDLIRKIANVFALVPPIAMTVSAFVMVVGCVGPSICVLTETRERITEFAVLRGLAYPRGTRVTTIIAAAVALSAWGASAAHGPEGDLHMASYQLPQSTSRTTSVVIVNKGSKTAILKEFQVESDYPRYLYCWSPNFEIPVAGDYILSFSVFDPLTKIKADPLKQFPSQAGRINLALEPNATGACTEHWKAKIRVAVVSDDGKRAKTDWFTLEKAPELSRFRKPQ